MGDALIGDDTFSLTLRIFRADSFPCKMERNKMRGKSTKQISRGNCNPFAPLFENGGKSQSRVHFAVEIIQVWNGGGLERERLF